MPQHHPTYGTLLTSKEVAALTGFTVNQLRNQRYRPETSPFPFIRLGGTSAYREDDIRSWLDGGNSTIFEYVVPEGITPAPLLTPTDAIQLKNYNEMKAIVTSNAWGTKGTYLIENSGMQDVYKKIDEWAEHFWALHTGKPSDENGWVPLGKARKEAPHIYWPSITWAVRRAYSEIRGWELTDDQILKAEIGEVPPSKIN